MTLRSYLYTRLASQRWDSRQMLCLTVIMTEVTAAVTLHGNALVAHTPCGHILSPASVSRWDRTRSGWVVWKKFNNGRVSEILRTQTTIYAEFQYVGSKRHKRAVIELHEHSPGRTQCRPTRPYQPPRVARLAIHATR